MSDDKSPYEAFNEWTSVELISIEGSDRPVLPGEVLTLIHRRWPSHDYTEFRAMSGNLFRARETPRATRRACWHC